MARRSSATTRVPAVGAPGRGRRRVRRLAQARLGQVGGVRVAGGLAPHDPDPGAALAARHQLLDLAVVEAGAGRAPVLGEHLGEVAAAAQGRGEGAFEDGGFDHVTFLPPDAPPVFPAR